MGLMVAVALPLVLASVAAAVLGHTTGVRGEGPMGQLRSTAPLALIATIGAGALMLCAMVVPGFSSFAAAALAMVLLSAVGAVAILRGTRGNRALVGLAIVDLGFMAGVMLLMPVHGESAVASGTEKVTGLATHPLAHAAPSGGLMIWLVLLVWAFCAAVLVVPGLRSRRRDSLYQSVCSGCMIAAMAAMTLTV